MQPRALGRLIFASVLLALGLAATPQTAPGQGTGCNSALPLTHVMNGPNSYSALRQHYVVLVSLDGFRWDYAVRDNATHLLALGKQGVWRLMACFQAIRRSPFPITSPSSPAFIPSTMAW